MSDQSLPLQWNGSREGAVTVNPVVLLSMLDHYIRRNENQQRVIGTLLGVRSDDGSEVEIKNCFPVSHTEEDEQVRGHDGVVVASGIESEEPWKG